MLWVSYVGSAHWAFRVNAKEFDFTAYCACMIHADFQEKAAQNMHIYVGLIVRSFFVLCAQAHCQRLLAAAFKVSASTHHLQVDTMQTQPL